MNTLALHPVTGAIGAEIVGFDIAACCDPALADYAAGFKAPCIAITSFRATRPSIAPAKSG